MIDETGNVYGKLKVNGKDRSGDRLRWICECACGNTTLVTGHDLRSGKSKSCGCSKGEYITKNRSKYGDISSKKMPEYTSWNRMIQRCYNENHDKYKYYGGRGIKVCDEWRHDFSAFLKDMGNRPSPKHSIDRINVDGDYEPSNCKWSTHSEQMINRRKLSSNTSGTTGVFWDSNSKLWRVLIFFKKKRYDLGYFKDKKEAIKARKDAEIKYWGKSS